MCRGSDGFCVNGVDRAAVLPSLAAFVAGTGSPRCGPQAVLPTNRGESRSVQATLGSSLQVAFHPPWHELISLRIKLRNRSILSFIPPEPRKIFEPLQRDHMKRRTASVSWLVLRTTLETRKNRPVNAGPFAYRRLPCEPPFARLPDRFHGNS